MDWEFSSAFSVESLSTQIYAVVVILRSSICMGKAWRTLAFHKAYTDLLFALKADGIHGNCSASCCFYCSCLKPETLLHPGLRTLA